MDKENIIKVIYRKSDNQFINNTQLDNSSLRNSFFFSSHIRPMPTKFPLLKGWETVSHQLSAGVRSFTAFPTVGAVHFVPELFSGPISVALIFGWTSAEALRLEGFRFHIDFTKMVGTGISKWNTERLFSVHVTSLRRRNWTAQADLPIPNTTVDGWYPMPVDSYLIVYGLFCVYMYIYICQVVQEFDNINNIL